MPSSMATSVVVLLMIIHAQLIWLTDMDVVIVVILHVFEGWIPQTILIA
jgi:hypothetical protein